VPDSFEFEKVTIESAKAALDAAAQPPATDGKPQVARDAQPDEALEPATQTWLESLPEDVRPVALAAAYPRIANRLCLLWRRVARCEEFLDELLVDRRGGRAGFPLAVAKELTVLRSYYAVIHPSGDSAWDLVGKSR
jgi:hypothetical protein